ncbi:Polysaccharide deacetylase [Natronoarchaeum philippinense]|uniref:Polysaccharide deacetylase n=1 Tax=Natronoarchaeum philippinense TaxID=558529 RepID=A0A285NTB2_NATPI|nr:polysaccharide deacetylase family protein [Natronoarchaeum philippinense]SNZ12689.1 Polysaccharide deacetylase [Natronoarchaeum philippinense]
MTGIVTLSVEVELAWGVHDFDGHDEHLSEDGRTERRYLRKLLDACDAASVPITFDIVDHLLLTSCEGTHDGPYPDDWFDADPGTDAAVDPLYYAPDIAEAIRSRPTDHELCTHSFSHAPLETVDATTVSADLERGQRVESELLGERSHSFVPPRHRPPPTDVLREHGIDVVRTAIKDQADGPLSRAAQLLFGPPPMVDPEWSDGVLWTYCATHPNLAAPTLPSGRRPAGRPLGWLPNALSRRLHRRYLERATEQAAETDAHLHLWCHLYDLSNDDQMAPLTEYLQTLGRLRDRGRVDICTMDELPDRQPIAVGGRDAASSW